MFEKNLRKIIIFTCVFGLFGILAIMYFFEASAVSISYLLSKDTREGVYLVSGQLKSLETKSNVLFFKLCDSFACISGVYFNPTKQVLDNLESAKQANQHITIKSRFEYYYGSPEIIAYKFYFEDLGDYSCFFL